MNREDPEVRLDPLITERALNPDMPAPAGMTSEEWDDVGELAAIERELRRAASVTPPLDLDPVALMLGLVPDPRVQLDGRALARARKASGQSAADLAGRLTARGWSVTVQQVFRWENQSSHDMPPAVINAVAAEVGTDPERLLTVRPSAVADPFDEAARSPRFRGLVARLAKVRGVALTLAESQLRGVAAVAVHRGDKPTSEQWLDSVESYVVALEQRHER